MIKCFLLIYLLTGVEVTDTEVTFETVDDCVATAKAWIPHIEAKGLKGAFACVTPDELEIFHKNMEKFKPKPKGVET